MKLETTTEPFSLIKLVKQLVSSRALIGIVVAALLLLLANLTFGAMNNYIYPNYFGSAVGMSVASFAGSIMTLLLAPVVPRLSEKYGKKELSVAGSLLGAAALIIAFFIHTDNLVLWLVLYLICYIGIALFNIMCWAMITDVIDDVEVKSGKRSDGTIYSVYSFARKLGQAASSGLSGAMLSAIGYNQATAFDPNVLDGIYNITCLVPAVGFILLALVLGFVYPLNKKTVDKNIATLKAKREGKEG